jgi:predicted nuclease with TOPRIM domain
MKAKPVTRAHFNANTIVGGITAMLVSLIGGVLLYLVTSGMTTAKEEAKKQTEALTTITTTLPFMQKSIDGVVADVKEANRDLKEQRSTMVTRNELTEKNTRITESIKEVKDSIKEVKDEQKAVRDKLDKR